MAYHNREKVRGLPLTPRIRQVIQEHAAVHEISENEMAVRMLDQLLNPGQQPVMDADAYGGPT